MIKITGYAKLIFDSLYDGILIVDKEGVVRYINPAYTRITKVEEKNIIGRYLSEVRPGSRLTDVVKDEKMELGAHRKMGDVEYLVNMVPIYEDGKVIGGISLLNELIDIYKLTEKLNLSKIIIQNLKEHVKTLGNGKYSFDDIITVDEKSIEVKEFAKRIALADSNVLITGESGTGKELYASAIHNFSARKDFPFIPVNCASFEKNLIESELFGYEEGSFTGAKKNGKTGLFQLAQGGTLFLDEVGDMPSYLQVKLLRVLERKEITRLGSNQVIKIDVRLIAATNKNMEELVTKGEFREDLYYRLNVIPIKLPPLRERKEDIKILAKNFIDKYSSILNKTVSGIDQNFWRKMEEYSWPGNVRELQNSMEYVVNMMKYTEVINFRLLPHKVLGKHITIDEEENFNLEHMEKRMIEKLLNIYGYSPEAKQEIAKKLGIGIATLYRKIKVYEL